MDATLYNFARTVFLPYLRGFSFKSPFKPDCQLTVICCSGSYLINTIVMEFLFSAVLELIGGSPYFIVAKQIVENSIIFSGRQIVVCPSNL